MGLLGHNGAGKSTTMSIMTGLALTGVCFPLRVVGLMSSNLSLPQRRRSPTLLIGAFLASAVFGRITTCLHKRSSLLGNHSTANLQSPSMLSMFIL